MLGYCQALFTQATHGSVQDKVIFCQVINDLMNTDKASEVYTTQFVDALLYEWLVEEFKVYTIVMGTHVLTEQIEFFKTSCLPYLPAIDLDAPNNFYSQDYLNQFKLLVDAKIDLEAIKDAELTSPGNIGLFGNPSMVQLVGQSQGDVPQGDTDLPTLK